MNNNIRFAIYNNKCEVIIYTDKNGKNYMTAGVYRMYVDEPVKRKLSFINNNSNIDIIAIYNRLNKYPDLNPPHVRKSLLEVMKGSVYNEKVY